MTAEERTDMLNDLEELVEKYGLQVGGYEDDDEECGMVKIILIR